MFQYVKSLPCWPGEPPSARSPSVSRFACNRATANPRRLQAENSTIILFKFASKLKHAINHPLSSEPWFAATAAGQSERRSSITPGISLNSGGAQVAQLVEHVTENHGVGGSIPPLGTISISQPFPSRPNSPEIILVLALLRPGAACSVC
jgi:hypothetical protein